jgi:hypothetical protein
VIFSSNIIKTPKSSRDRALKTRKKRRKRRKRKKKKEKRAPRVSSNKRGS